VQNISFKLVTGFGSIPVGQNMIHSQSVACFWGSIPVVIAATRDAQMFGAGDGAFYGVGAKALQLQLEEPFTSILRFCSRDV